MDDRLKLEAEQCRGRALTYLGRPEATFLLRIAREFERLENVNSKTGPKEIESTNGR